MPDNLISLTSAVGDLAAPHHSEGWCVVDPLTWQDWNALLRGIPESSFFHGSAWAQVLHQTYGHRPVYVCRFAGGRLQELLPIMEVSSPFSGCRGVSLPFTDVCPVLTTPNGEVGELFEQAMEQGRRQRWRYLQCRGGGDGWEGAAPSVAYYGHRIDLDQPSGQLFASLDDAVRRGIRKAGKTGVQVEFSSSPESMRTFYGLHCQTRRRHGLPPQPVEFFENIARHVLAAGKGFVATARLRQQPLAAAVYLQHGREAFYKFGASDFAFQSCRPNNLLMWEAMKRCSEHGFASLHLGRTSLANEGLRRFKLGFGAREERIEYCQYDFARQSFVTDVDRAEGWFNRVFRCLPMPLLRLAGRVLYPHLS